MVSAEEGSPQLHPGRPPLSLGTRGEQASFILPPPCSLHLPQPSLAGLVVVERGEVLGQNEDFIYLFISISFALCLVPEFAGGSKKEEREEVIMLLHKQPFRAGETGRWLGTSFWGWGGASRRHEICIEVSAGHQCGVKDSDSGSTASKLTVTYPQLGVGVLAEHPKSSFTFLPGRSLPLGSPTRQINHLLAECAKVSFVFVFWSYHVVCGILVPDQGRTCPLQRRKRGALTTELPGRHS